MKKINILAFLGLTIFSACQRADEKTLLRPQVYFSNKQEIVEVDEQKVIEQSLRARLSSAAKEDADLTFMLGGEELVKQYNEANGTDYLLFDMKNVALSTNSATIKKGNYFSDNVELQFSGLNTVEEGKKYLVPVQIESSNIPVLKGADVLFFLLNKPVKINTVWRLERDYIKLPLVVDRAYSSVTYEVLVKFEQMNSNNTIMGTEGILILRVGDPALPGGANNLIQIAGSKQFHSDKVKFEPGRWYHVAYTYDSNSGATVIYVNGEKAAEAKWDSGSKFVLGQDPYMSIGRIEQFMWGTRPTNGYMSEARFWSVARTQQQIQQNMLTVDPASEGLEAYYKLNGKDQVKEDGVFVIKDASPKGLNGIPNGGRGIKFVKLEEPVKIN